MTRYTIFLLPSGRGFGHVDYEPSDDERAQGDMTYVAGDYPTDDYYLDNGLPTLRPRIVVSDDLRIRADDAETVGFDVPPGTTIGWDTQDGRQQHMVDDGRVEWSTAEPGDHYLLVQPPFPWVTIDLRVTAYAPS